ncbi:uncharacterized protein LOC135489829 [Lineus longissimus]|uniref:uncharacterized protein LOC135489829 n=1 Tax=Lineus longissimus TaxID=88925 RepID=UPI002B4F4935
MNTVLSELGCHRGERGIMMSSRSTILGTRPIIGGDVGRCSAQIMVLGGLMALPGGIITGIGYAGGEADSEQFYMLGPILLALGTFLVILGITFKVLVMRGLIKPGANNAPGNVLELPPDQLRYPWTMSQPASMPNFPPAYCVEMQSTDISQEEGPPMYTPSGENQSTDISQVGPPMYTPSPEMDATTESSAYVNEAFSDIPVEPPPSYEESETVH